jgi:hypothetical protein
MDDGAGKKVSNPHQQEYIQGKFSRSGIWRRAIVSPSRTKDEEK